MAKILVACEYSGIVSEAFRANGHEAWSCDLLPTDGAPEWHIQGDARQAIADLKPDLLIAHPPCTRLTNAGVRWLTGTKLPKTLGWSYSEDERAWFKTLSDEDKHRFLWADMRKGAALFSDFLNADVRHVCIENPVMHRYAKEAIDGFFPATQSVQPWEYEPDGHGPDDVKKRTCFWIKGLPALQRTGTLDGSTARAECHLASPGEDRGKIRSRFYRSIAKAMADQWGALLG